MEIYMKRESWIIFNKRIYLSELDYFWLFALFSCKPESWIVYVCMVAQNTVEPALPIRPDFAHVAWHSSQDPKDHSLTGSGTLINDIEIIMIKLQ